MVLIEAIRSTGFDFRDDCSLNGQRKAANLWVVLGHDSISMSNQYEAWELNVMKTFSSRFQYQVVFRTNRWVPIYSVAICSNTVLACTGIHTCWQRNSSQAVKLSSCISILWITVTCNTGYLHAGTELTKPVAPLVVPLAFFLLR